MYSQPPDFQRIIIEQMMKQCIQFTYHTDDGESVLETIREYSPRTQYTVHYQDPRWAMLAKAKLAGRTIHFTNDFSSGVMADTDWDFNSIYQYQIGDYQLDRLDEMFTMHPLEGRVIWEMVRSGVVFSHYGETLTEENFADEYYTGGWAGPDGQHSSWMTLALAQYTGALVECRWSGGEWMEVADYNFPNRMPRPNMQDHWLMMEYRITKEEGGTPPVVSREAEMAAVELLLDLGYTITKGK